MLEKIAVLLGLRHRRKASARPVPEIVENIPQTADEVMRPLRTQQKERDAVRHEQERMRHAREVEEQRVRKQNELITLKAEIIRHLQHEFISQAAREFFAREPYSEGFSIQPNSNGGLHVALINNHLEDFSINTGLYEHFSTLLEKDQDISMAVRTLSEKGWSALFIPQKSRIEGIETSWARGVERMTTRSVPYIKITYPR